MDCTLPRTTRPKALVISAVHDPRAMRRASIVSFAEALTRKGFDTSFLSVRFSGLSLLKRDLRCPLWSQANALERVGELDCFLWRTPVHPFEIRPAWLGRAMAGWYETYGRSPNARVDAMIAAADVIVVESGLGIVLAPRVRVLNPSALLIYRASDALDTIGADPKLQGLLERYGDHFDHFCVLGRAMASHFGWARERTYYVGQAITPADFALPGENPFGDDRVVVSVGSMLFDTQSVKIAAALFPDVRFMMIGSGARMRSGANLEMAPEMPFRETLRYVAHATVGLAPYRDGPGVEYLADSSLKLAQYGHYRRPAVCPHFAVGGRPGRFGYRPGDPAQIRAAITSALNHPVLEPAPLLNWDEAVDRMLWPRGYPDTTLAPAWFERGTADSTTPVDLALSQ